MELHAEGELARAELVQAGATRLGFILLIGIFHHLDNRSIKKFIKKVKKFKFLSIDAVILPNQSFITKILFFLDRGRFIRELKDYKKLLVHANYKLLRNRYIRAPYDHVMFFKNIDKKKNR